MSRGVVWTDEMDQVLAAGREAEPPEGWAKLVLRLPGVSRKQAEARWAWLKGASPDAEAPLMRDGLEWLLKKRRLKAHQAEQAERFRRLFRDAGGVSIRSSADIGAGGGTPGPGHFDAVLVSHTQAQRDLFRIRYVTLRGQVDMLTVMDGVCGVGHTLRALAGDDKVRAAELEAVLRVALDLLHEDQRIDVKKVA